MTPQSGHDVTVRAVGDVSTTEVNLRREIRGLPRDRRRELGRALRDGRPVDDPRDAALAVAWAQRMQRTWWPRWLLPATRPHRIRAFLWGVHAAWLVVVIVAVLINASWHRGEIIRWATIGLLAYSLVSTSWFFRLILRTRWNAPEAERRNRELLDASEQSTR